MSRRDNYRRDYDNYDRDYSRSRNKNQQWRRDKNNQYQQEDRRNWRSNHHQKNRNNYYENDRRQQRRNFNNQIKTVRSVISQKVPDPQNFLICSNPTFVDPNLPKFTLKIEKSQHPPTKIPSKADELKNKITPIEKLWTSHIKQYLNDSEFVEIYRKNKSLAFGDVEYGKTIINYDEGDKSMYYQNQSSQSKVFSRAYFKIWEILNMNIFQNKLNDDVNIASVAEGPGGFIHALIDYRLKHSPQIKDKYFAITLKITENTRNAKDWSDFRAKTHFDQMRSLGYKIKLSYGQTGTGDLLKQQNIDCFADHDLQGKKCFLVTGDGGIECIGDKQFDYQQVFNVKLFLGEFLAALKVQQIGGKFILKIYDCSFQLTKQLLALLCVFYKKVRIVKPVTSRPGNSQKYMLCQDFLGMSKQQQATIKQLLKKWTQIEPNLTYFENKQYITNILDFSNFKNYKQVHETLQKANNFFLQQQIDKLEQGIKLAQANQNDYRKIQQILKVKRFKQQMGYASNWCKKYGISHIEVKQEDQSNQGKQDLAKNQQQKGQKEEKIQQQN